MYLRTNINEHFSTSVSNVTQSMKRILQKNVDLSTIIQYRNLSYGDHPLHTCDIWYLKERKVPQPTVFYIHGGGFRRLNKDIM
jgi:acetyl esterase/lipase